MKSVLIAILISGASILTISSCATAPKVPLGAGELRLLSVDVPQSGNINANVIFWVKIYFEANGQLEIDRACFNISGDGPDCVDVRMKDVIYESRPYFQVPLRVPAGQKKVDCYAEYIRNGERQRTNTVTSYVIAYDVR